VIKNVDGPLVLVTVGTDAFPFDRLMEWLARWIERQPIGAPRVLIQSGPSRPPRGAESTPFLPYDQLQEAIGEATVVVCHGAGPSILETMERGLVPIVVPRRRALGKPSMTIRCTSPAGSRPRAP